MIVLTHVCPSKVFVLIVYVSFKYRPIFFTPLSPSSSYVSIFYSPFLCCKDNVCLMMRDHAMGVTGQTWGVSGNVREEAGYTDASKMKP